MNTIYNYRKAVIDDILNYFEENNIDKERIKEDSDYYDEVFDDMFNCDNVTGNASGSYTFSSIDAERNLVGNWGLASDSLKEFDCEEGAFERGPEYVDVTIRCYLLSGCLVEVVEDLI